MASKPPRGEAAERQDIFVWLTNVVYNRDQGKKTPTMFDRLKAAGLLLDHLPPEAMPRPENPVIGQAMRQARKGDIPDA